MDKMWNLVISFPGNVTFGGKMYHLDRNVGLFLTNSSMNLKLSNRCRITKTVATIIRNLFRLTYEGEESTFLTLYTDGLCLENKYWASFWTGMF